MLDREDVRLNPSREAARLTPIAERNPGKQCEEPLAASFHVGGFDSSSRYQCAPYCPSLSRSSCTHSY
eukprot:1624959-Rhodomonas_salina.2